MEFDPAKNYQFSLRLESVDPDEVELRVGPTLTELFCSLCNFSGRLRDRGMDPGSRDLTEPAIAERLKRGRPEYGPWDKQSVHEGLLKLRDAGLVSFLCFGEAGEMDAFANQK